MLDPTYKVKDLIYVYNLPLDYFSDLLTVNLTGAITKDQIISYDVLIFNRCPKVTNQLLSVLKELAYIPAISDKIIIISRDGGYCI